MKCLTQLFFLPKGQFGYHFKPNYVTRVYRFPIHNFQTTKRIWLKQTQTRDPIVYQLEATYASDSMSDRSEGNEIFIGLPNLLFVDTFDWDNEHRNVYVVS